MNDNNKQTLTPDDVLASKLPLIEKVVGRLMKDRRMSRVLDPDDARSVACEAVWLALGGHDAAKGDLDSYVRHKARFAVLMAARKARMAARRAGGKASTEAGGGNTVEGVCVHEEIDSKSVRAWRDGEVREQIAEGVREALSDLDPAEQAVVDLLGEGVTGRPELMEKLGIGRKSLVTVLTRLRRRLAPFAAGAGL